MCFKKTFVAYTRLLSILCSDRISLCTHYLSRQRRASISFFFSLLFGFPKATGRLLIFDAVFLEKKAELFSQNIWAIIAMPRLIQSEASFFVCLHNILFGIPKLLVRLTALHSKISIVGVCVTDCSVMAVALAVHWPLACASRGTRAVSSKLHEVSLSC